MKKLVISDWFGTIDLSWHIFDECYRRTVKGLFGVEGSMRDDPNYFASTNTDVVSEIARKHGIPEDEISSKKGLILPAYANNFLNVLEQGKLRILPGARGLFYGLKRNSVPLALISGESKATLDALVRKAGLGIYFPEDMRSYGDEAGDRIELVKVAIERAENKHAQFPKDGIYLLDDSARGLSAGNSLGIVTIGVASGPTKHEELALSNHHTPFWRSRKS
jgi:phosphoglycolate phosphatase-like HAD superfamily hydrolase